MRNRLFLVFFLLLGTALHLHAQEKPLAYFENPRVTDKLTGKPMANVTVTVESSGSTVETKTTGSNGKFKLNPIKLDQKYKITFSAPGYQTRFIEVDLTGIPPAHIPEEGYNFPLDMSMVPKLPDIDYSPLENKSTGIIHYDKKAQDVDWDFKTVEAYNSEQAKILKKIEEKDKGNKEADAKFAKLVQEGDAATGKSDFVTAIAKYTEALTVKKDPAVEKKLEDVKKKQEDAEKSKGVDKQYQEKITAADQAFKSKDYATAKILYTEAGKLKPSEPLPPQKITEIDKLIAAEMEKEKNYSAAITEGNKLFDEGKYDQAIAKYTDAQKIKPAEQEPKDLIAKATAKKAEAGKKDQEFLTYVKKGDDANTAKKLDDAILNYSEALKIKQDPAVQTKLDKAKSDKAALDAANKQYNDLITEADKDFTASNWDKAIDNYSKAQALKPSEKYPADQLMLAKQKKADAEKNASIEKQYNDLMKQGETDFNAKQWDKAITSYEAAKKVKPAESKPQEMIDLANQKKQEEQDKEKNAALDKQYNELMKQGETDLTANQYDKAITSFEAAKKVKPAESKPDEMIELARKKKQELADKEANSKKAKDLITKGDAEMPKKNYEGAIGFYEEAVGLDPLPEYKSKLEAARKAKTDAEAADKAKQAQEVKYQEFITKGDSELGNSEYDKAIASYNEALKIKPGEKYPTDQIAIATKKKADAEKNAAQEKQYTDLMKQGETDFNAKQWDKAITSYEAAKKVKPAESKPQEMIDLAKQKKQEEADAEKNAALDKQYNDLMKQGDVDLAANQYDKAITSYEAAKKVKPTESKPQEMIDLARQKKADEMDKQARINKAKDLVAKGDNELTKKQYDNAISHYEEAIGLDPKPEYQSKLDAARKAKSDEELANKSKAEKETQYKDFLAQGDDAYRNGEWDKAISAYNSALAIKPGEKYPTEQVTLCKQKKSDAEAAAAKDKEYNDFMAKADADLEAGNFDKAIENYTKASGVKPTERRPGEQIAIAKQRKAEKEANAASEAEKKAKYKVAMEEGVKFQTEGKFDQAIQKYEEALNYQPGDKNAQDQLEKAKKDKDSKEQDKRRMYDDLVKFADKEFNAGNYADAKGYYDRAANVLKNEQYPKDRSIESQKKLDEKNALDAKRTSYNEAVKKADEAFNTSNWQASIPLYEAAANIIPDELYPGQQIEKAKQKIQEQKDREADKLRLEKEYAAKIKEADQAFKGNQLDEAINFYNEALAIKKDEPYPKAQIDLINKKKEELRQKDDQAKLDAEYKEIIIRADEAFNAKQWDQSIDLYTSAKGIKPSEKYPSDQIVKAKAKKAEEAANSANAAKLEEQRQRYLAKIKEADDLFNAERYEECKKVYAEAAGIKSDETYPQEQIDKANARMKELAEANIRKQYDLIIAQADKDFDAGNLSDAKGYYERALKIRPNDQHPKNRIDEINKRIQADASNAEKRKKYETIVKRADGELNKSDFDKSIASYTEALTVFPDESYPKEKIEEARRLKAEKDALASAKEKYKAEMNKGMESYNSGTFDKAIVHFENALGHVPNDSEATKMLEKARKELKERGDFLKQQYTALISAADENFNSGKLDDAEGLYNRALKLMPNEQYPKDQLAKIDAKRKLSSGASDYNKVIAEANTKFNTKDYSSARELYVKASEIQPTIDYPKKRIKEIDDLLKTTNSGGNTNPGPVVGNTNNTKVIVEKNYGTPINIDIKAAQEMIAQASREKEEDRHKLTDSTKLLTEELQRKSGDKQNERLEENAEEFVKMKEKYDEFATNGERNLQDNIASYQNLKENREEKNSELSGNTDERLLDKSKEMEQIKTDFVYAEVGTDAVRQENIKTTAETKENRYNKEAELEGNTNEKRQETAEKLRQDNFQLQDQMAEKDETIRTQNANNLAEFKEERYNRESQLEGNTNEKRQERSEQLTQDQFKLQDQLAEKDETVRTVKANEIAELKEERYVKESELEGNTNEKRQARSEQLTQDNFRLQDQMAEKDVVRIKNEDSIAHFKEDRYEDESKMEGNTDIKRINKSEELTQNNYQLQDQLAKTDVVRQENERTISTTKEERYVKESELEGNTNEKRQETAEKLRQDNFQLQDQMAEKDETIRTQNANNLAEFKEERYNRESQLEGNTDEKRQEKAEQLRQDNFSLQDQMAVKDETVRNRNANNLAEFKEERYIKESELEGNTDAKRIDRSEQLTQDQFKLEDQMAGRDVVRQENEKTVAAVKEERYVKESNLSGNTDDRLQNKKDSLVAQTNRQEGQFSDLDKMKDKNHQELEAKKQGYNEQTDQNAKTSDNNRQRNQDQLQSQQYRTNDPRANTTGVLVKEQSFQRNDPSGKPMEVTVQRIVRKGNQTSEYLMIINRTGNSYFKDGSPISETQWSTETGVPKE